MGRPSKLSAEQCAQIRMLHDEGKTGPTLAKRFKISESSLYKILNGSYVEGASTGTELPPLVESDYKGATPSLFNKAQAASANQLNPQGQQLSNRVIGAADAATHHPIDEITLAAAELIIAQAKYLQVRKRTS